MCGRYTLACPDEETLIRGLPFDAFSETRIQFRPPVLADALWGMTRSGGGLAINARSETAERTALFRDAFADGRCLVPADGFFEWRKEGRVNQPYLFRRTDGTLFVMAGLWQDGRYVVLTRDSRGEVTEIHDRMPVLLNGSDAHQWLTKGKLAEPPELTRTA
ncbi:MAG: SOS response-associated peptidase, partial [Deltaproteobacteria bacterium]|nr:SOS response-associated peptidase [Deltaproteobacteria bacterium]